MVIDTSALLAILQDEPERRAYNEAIEEAASRNLSVASFVEVSMVIETRYGAEGLRDLDLFIELNYGDCFAYALARVLGEPLLFKGDDFSRTDLEPAVPQA